MGLSLRVIKVLEDTSGHTVELEYEIEDPKELVTKLAESQIGRKMLSLMTESFSGVEPAMPETQIAEAKAYEEQLIEQGRQEIFKKAKEIGIDLEKNPAFIEKQKEGEGEEDESKN